MNPTVSKENYSIITSNTAKKGGKICMKFLSIVRLSPSLIGTLSKYMETTSVRFLQQQKNTNFDSSEFFPSC